MSRLFAGTQFEQPATCERCEKPLGACTCPRDKNGKVVDPKVAPVRVRREKRGGKLVTVIAGLTMRDSDKQSMLKQLKATLGAGGALNEDGDIEVQGDHRDKLVQHFVKQGYPAKPAGG
ncbi:MAG: translation initiation factor [Phycisphaerae bacterium]|jgi:translation initiation factor 1